MLRAASPEFFGAIVILPFLVVGGLVAYLALRVPADPDLLRAQSGERRATAAGDSRSRSSKPLRQILRRT